MTDISLKEHFERLIKEQDRRIDQAHQSAQEARAQAQLAMEKRLDVLNHYKAEYAEKEANYARKDQVARVVERIEELEKSRNIAYGVIGFVMFVAGLPLLYLIFLKG